MIILPCVSVKVGLQYKKISLSLPSGSFGPESIFLCIKVAMEVLDDKLKESY